MWRTASSAKEVDCQCRISTLEAWQRSPEREAWEEVEAAALEAHSGAEAAAEDLEIDEAVEAVAEV